MLVIDSSVPSPVESAPHPVDRVAPHYVDASTPENAAHQTCEVMRAFVLRIGVLIGCVSLYYGYVTVRMHLRYDKRDVRTLRAPTCALQVGLVHPPRVGRARCRAAPPRV